MDLKAKSGSKPAPKTEKKDLTPLLKPDPAPAEPGAPANAEKPAEDGTGNQEGSEAAGGCCETLENLKPFFIGGALVALGAIVVGVVLLARKK